MTLRLQVVRALPRSTLEQVGVATARSACVPGHFPAAPLWADDLCIPDEDCTRVVVPSLPNAACHPSA